jgi:hypothetical protein
MNSYPMPMGQNQDSTLLAALRRRGGPPPMPEMNPAFHNTQEQDAMQAQMFAPGQPQMSQPTPIMPQPQPPQPAPTVQSGTTQTSGQAPQMPSPLMQGLMQKSPNAPPDWLPQDVPWPYR